MAFVFVLTRELKKSDDTLDDGLNKICCLGEIPLIIYNHGVNKFGDKKLEGFVFRIYAINKFQAT